VGGLRCLEKRGEADMLEKNAKALEKEGVESLCAAQPG
jgi:hypothetical protein